MNQVDIRPALSPTSGRVIRQTAASMSAASAAGRLMRCICSPASYRSGANLNFCTAIEAATRHVYGANTTVAGGGAASSAGNTNTLT